MRVWLKILAVPIIIIIIAIFYESRAFVFGAMVAASVLFYLSFPVLKKYTTSILFAVVIIFSILFWYKLDSSLGRVLIYKISAQMLKDNWLCGIGFGEFYGKYLYYQAAYFEKGVYSEKEFLLAGNTHYAFNEYLKILVEMGVWVIIPVISLLYFYIKLLRLSVSKYNGLIYYTLHSIILTIIIASCFTNTFSRSGIWIVVLTVCVSGVWFLQKINVKFLLILFFCISLGILALEITSYKAEITLNELRFKFTNGELTIEDIEKYMVDLRLGTKEKKIVLLQLYSRYFQDEDKWEQALLNTLALARFKPNHIVFVNLGYIYENLGEIKEAERWYLLSVHSVPNRIMSRNELFEFYLKIGKIEEAKRVGKELLQMPIKVNSEIVEQIKAKLGTKLNYL